MNHQILGLSSRKVSLTRYTLTFRTCISHRIAVDAFITQILIQVHDVEEVKVWVKVNSCRVVVAVRFHD